MSETTSRIGARLGLLAACGVCACTLSGCFIPLLVGGVAENIKKDTTHSVKAEYDGLQGKTFAVVCTADRMIQAEHGGLIETVIKRFHDRLHAAGVGTGHSDTAELVHYLYNHPDWYARPLPDLAKELGVDMLVFVEITEFGLHDPGNQYLWNGVAAGTVQVIDANDTLGGQYAFQRGVRVKFPDKEGFGPADFTATQVSSALLTRFMDRASWPFYTHEEPWYPEY
jgi:hypothetical protein